MKSFAKAVNRIRKLGLKNRMPCEPNEYISKMNKLCMQMTFAKRKTDGKRSRKAILRKMKKLLKKVANKDKLLSIYEDDVHVIVRHKSDAEVEFGNTPQTVAQHHPNPQKDEQRTGSTLHIRLSTALLRFTVLVNIYQDCKLTLTTAISTS